MDNYSFAIIFYLAMTICSLLLLITYRILLKGKIDKNALLVFLSVTFINFAYLLLSISPNVQLAIWANRISYCGSVVLLVEMYKVINKFCNVLPKKSFDIVILVISFCALALALTGGSTIKLYYRSVDIRIVSGVTNLVKEYGPLYNLYSYYVLMMFFIMIFTAIKAIVTKKIINSINPITLLILVTQNIIVWYAERLLGITVELLATSYVCTEAILLVTLKNASDNRIVNKEMMNVEKILEKWKESYSLTERESEITGLLIKNISRSDIASKLCISEHTVKKHTAHIYEKINVTSRNDLLVKFNQELMD